MLNSKSESELESYKLIIDKLPIDILIQITNNLTIFDIINLSLTNHHFNQFIKLNKNYIYPIDIYSIDIYNATDIKKLDKIVYNYPNIKLDIFVDYNDILNKKSLDNIFDKFEKVKKNIFKLNLSDCAQLLDHNLLSLTNVRILNLTNCYQITDLSSLSNVYDLNLTNCNQITDLSPLTNIRILNLTNCYQITDLSHLINVHELNLSGCYQIRNHNLLSLTNIYKLNISGCYQITDLTPLTNVYDLNLSSCYQIRNHNLLSLTNVRILNLTDCYHITDLTPLTNVRILNLTDCFNLKLNGLIKFFYKKINDKMFNFSDVFTLIIQIYANYFW